MKTAVSSDGFTLMELMAGLLILSILASISAPLMSHLINSHRLAASANQMLGMIFTARAEGAYRSAMLICSGKGQCANFSTPDNTLILVADRNNSRSLDQGDDLMETLTLPSGMTAQWRSFRNRPWLRINRYGVAYYQNGHFLLCYHGLARKITVNYHAKARIDPNASTDNCPDNH